MKVFQFIGLCFALILISACGSKPERPAPILTPDRIAAANAIEQQNSSALAGLVQHYSCPNECEGSGGDAAGTCPVCGTEYQHNQAWHTQQQQQNNGVTTTTTTSDGSGPTVGVTPPSQATPEPPQNAAGVWHYICPNGHAGGGGGATACTECGTTLVHNSAYH